jgi:ABC-type uncharacterized transport system auxiliary subunit
MRNPMRFTVRCTVSLVVLALICSGCGGAARPMRFYTLDPPNVTASASQPYAIDLLIGRFTAPQLYRDTRIVYRGGGNQVGTYETQRWAEPPAQMVSDHLLHALRSGGRYRNVQLLTSATRGQFILRGHLDRFEEITGSALVTRIDLYADLFDPKTGLTAWSKDYEQSEPVNGKDVSAVVESLNRNLQRAVSDINASLDQYFATHPPAPPAEKTSK